MLDLEAPILPGHSAAGYQIGTPIEALPKEELARFQRAALAARFGKSRGFRYTAEQVSLWVDAEGSIEQIAVKAGYRGKLLGTVGLGMTIADLERLIGSVAVDGEDALSIFGLWGLCFELDSYPAWLTAHFPDGYPDFTLPAWQGAHLVWLAVFQAREIAYFPWIAAMPYVPKEALHKLPEDALLSVPPLLLLNLPEEVLTHLPERVLRHVPEAVLARLPEERRSRLAEAY